MTTFDDFGLADPIRRALAEENYTVPTPIQAQTIPIALTGRDVVGIAQTGTGKTAAFALPILHRIAANRLPLQKKSCRTLILSPTRELSAQILDSIQAYGRHLHISATLAIGGVSMGTQVRALMNGVDVLVATPGRLLDLVQSNALRLGQVDCLVLDEADRMLDMGFINDIRKIVSKLPKERQTLFFSATMPQAIAELASQMLRDPARVAVTPVASTAERVEQRVIHVDRGGKPNLLVQLLKEEPVERVLVFTRTKHGADKVVRNLVKSGIPAEAIHGNKSQNQRNRALDNFRSGSVRTLVATDIAARGIDVDGVSHVFNFDLPNIPDSYVHRIGRTARAGAEGIAISFCDADEVAFLRDIERLIRQKIPATDKRTQQTALPEAGAPQPHRQQKAGGRGGRNNPPRRNSRPAYGRDGGGRDGGQGRDQNQGHGRSQDNRGDNRGDSRNAPQNRPAPASVSAYRAEPSRPAKPEQQGRPENQNRPNRHNPQAAQPRRNGGEDRFTGRADSLSGVAFMQRTGQKRRNNNRPQRPTS